MDFKFLLRKSTGDQPIVAESDLLDLVKKGQCKAADFLYEFATGKWTRVGDHPSLSALFADKPGTPPDRRVIYFLSPGVSTPQGPFSTKEIQARAQGREICAATWVFVEGDKEWRQVRNVKILHEMLPALPADKPAQPAPEPKLAPASPDILASLSAPAAPPAAAPADGDLVLGGGSISLGMPDVPPAAPPGRKQAPALDIGASAAGGPPPLSLSLESGAPQVPPAATPDPSSGPTIELGSMPSITLDLGGDEPPGAPKAPGLGATAVDPGLKDSLPPAAAPGSDLDDPHIEREEVTLALDTMGLNLHSEHISAPSAPPSPLPRPLKPGIAPAPGGPPGLPPQAPPRSAPPGAPPARPAAPAPGAPPATPPGGAKAKPKADSDFDGIVAEVPTDPIWLVKQASGEAVSGPFRFLEVIKFLEEGKLTKNDKIARAGTKAFTKISLQYEFNVKYSVETVVENGQEKQKILIRRRHPRVPYITGVQILSKHGLLAGQCVNISAGGILMEVPKAEFNLGEIIEVKILPGLIAKSISCKSLIIGKIPKIPPGYALKFEDLKPEDKEAIEYYVQETLKREMSKKN